MSVNTARHRPALDDAAEIHHRHPGAEPADDAEIVADEQEGQAAPLLQLLQQQQDLRLHRDVERGDRLVGDDQLGLQRQGAGDADALALAAAELVRVAVERGRRQADFVEQGGGARRALAAAARCRGRAAARSASAPIGGAG